MPLPDDGPGAPGEPLRRRRHARPLRPRRRASPRCSPATADEVAALLGAPRSPSRRQRPRAASRPALPRAGRATRRRVRRAKEHIRRRRRVPDRPLAAGRAADRRLGARALPRAPPDQPLAVPLPARARRPRARRLLARDARQARGQRARASTRSPARRRRARATRSGCSPPRRTAPSTSCSSTSAATTSRASAGPAPCASSGSSRPSATRTSRTSSPRSPASSRRGRTAFDLLRACFPAGTVSRRAEGARDADHLGARGLPARPVRRRGRLRAPGRGRSTRASRSARSSCATASRGSRPGGGIVADSDPARSTRSACASSPRSRRRIDLAEGGHVILLVDNYDSFTYNLAHLFEELGAEVTVLPKRRDRRRRGGAARAERTSSSPPGPGGRRTPARRVEIVAPARAARPDARRLPRPPGDRRGVRRRGRPGAASSCTARRARSRHDGQRHLRGPSASRSRPGATTRSPRRACPTSSRCRATHRRRRGDGRPPPRAARSTASSSIRSRC